MTAGDKLVNAAAAELGVSEPESGKYMRELFPELPESGAWCAAFVSWCAKRAQTPEAVFPRHASCTLGRALWRALGVWKERGYVPRAGDIVYFDWDSSGDCDHVGIVTGCENGVMSTIEGNRSNAVRRESYALTDGSIAGFASPDYDAHDWSAEAVSWARERNILRGDGRGDARLTDFATREETVTLLYRALHKTT